MITAEQVAHFRTFGFLVFRQLFTPDEVDLMRREALEIMAEERGDAVPGEKWEAVQPFLERKPFLASLVDDDRVHQIPETLLGPDFFLEGTEGNLHMGSTPWHGAGGTGPSPIPHIKVTFYLDPVSRDSGCLRVIPGSHVSERPDVYASLRDRTYDDDFMPFGVAPSEVPHYALESEPGDLVVFTEDLLHASFGGKAGRHQHACSFMAGPKTEADVEWLRGVYKRYRFALHPSRSFVNSERPRIRRMVSKLVELGFEEGNC